MQIDFLFLIPITPKNLLNDQRRALQSLCFNQLLELQSSYRVWLLGEADFFSDNFEQIELNASSKEDKLYLAGQKLESMKVFPARYLVRLDDDDLINPVVFDELASEQFDIAYDSHHCFYDLSSGLTSSQKREWIPNTAIHRMEMALEKVDKVGGSELAIEKNYLMACDHSKAWKSFYRGKKIKQSDPSKPIYLRVLNNSSRTALGSASNDSKNEYFRYLKTFGSWKSPFPLENELKNELLRIGKLGGRSLENWNFPKMSLLQRIKRKIRG